MARRGSAISAGRSVRGHNSVATRAAILRAAERIFAESDLTGARIDAIAAAAGVNKALLYYYFRSKDGLYRAVLMEHLKDFRRQALEVLSSRGSAGSIVLRYVSMHFDFISARPYSPPLFQRLAMRGGKTFERLVREYSVPMGKKFAAVIERGVRSGEFRSFDSGHMALSLVGLTSVYFSVAPVIRAMGGMDPFEEKNLARRKQEVFKFIRYALFRKPEAALR